MQNNNKNLSISENILSPARYMYRKQFIKKMIELAFLISLIGTGSVSAYASQITSVNILDQINNQRQIRGLNPLKIDNRLDQAAEEKSRNMIDKDYFEHYGYGLTPWNFITKQNYNYLYAGENLAMDFHTSEGMVRAWMSSPSHRKNILNSDFEDIGLGVVKGEYSDNSGTHETIMVTNMFGKEKPKILQLFDNMVSKIKSIF